MAKNPICPIYYNDLLGATKTWTDEEFGCYVRLLLEQWDKGFIPNPYQKATKNLPNDYQRLLRIATSVDKNWDVLSTKFKEGRNGLYNENMEEIRLKRQKNSETQSDNVRKRYEKVTKLDTNDITKSVPSDEHEYDNGIILDSIKFNWLTQTFQELGLTNGSQKFFYMVVVEMMNTFLRHKPGYSSMQEVDYPALLRIAYMIAMEKGWKKAEVVDVRETEVIKSWDTIVGYIVKSDDKFFKKLTIKALANPANFQSLKEAMRQDQLYPLNKKIKEEDRILPEQYFK